MTCVETFATLRIFSEDIHPEKIGEILGIEGTRMLPRNPDSKYRPRRETNYWGWETLGFVESTDNIEHITAIIEQLDGRSSALRELRELGCQTDICNYWVSTGQGGPGLSIEIIGCLQELGLAIWWDVYFEREGEREI